jgi:hypothetical protein
VRRALEEAERWIASRPRDAPAATAEMQTFVTQSRRGATRRRNALTGSLAVGLIVALALAALAYWQRSLAIVEREKADAQRNLALVAQKTAEGERSHALDERDRAIFALRDAELQRQGSASIRSLAQAGEGRAQVEQSLRLAEASRKATQSGNSLLGLLLALEALPDEHETQKLRNRPRVAVAEASAYEALDSYLYGFNGVINVGDKVRTVAFSPDGKRLVAGTWEGRLAVFDSISGQLVLTLQGHQKAINTVAYSPDGTLIASGSFDGSVSIWSAESGAHKYTLNRDASSVWRVAFSPDSIHLATASKNGRIAIYDTSSQRRLLLLAGHTAEIQAAGSGADIADVNGGEGLPRPDVWVVMRTARFASGLL